MLTLAQTLNYRPGIANAYNCLGSIYAQKKNRTNTALSSFYFARDIYAQIGDQRDLGGTLCNIGQVYCRVHQYTLAMDTLLLAKQLLTGVNDPAYLAYTLYWIGNTFLYKKQYPEALENYAAAKTIYENNDCKQGLAIVYLQIAELYRKQKKYEAAASAAETALKLANETAYTVAITRANECLQKVNRHRK